MRNDYEGDELPPRENLMQRRLRKARGEDVADEPELYQPYDEEEQRPRSLGGGYERFPPPRGRYSEGGGCGQATLYLLLGLIGAALIGVLLLNQTLGGLGRLFAGVPRVPDLATIIITPTPQVITSAAVIQRVQQLSRLETAEYTVQTVIEVNQSQGNPIFDYFAGDALLLIAQGTVVAGLDLSALPPESVTVSADGQTVTLRLPPAQIFSVTLDSEGTRVYSRNRGWFAPDNKDLETLARQQAEHQILASACTDGILNKATGQAEEALRQFLGLVDGAQIIVTSASPQPCEQPATAPTP